MRYFGLPFCLSKYNKITYIICNRNGNSKYKYSLCKAVYRLVCIAVFNSISHTMPDMTFQNHFAAAVKRRLRRIDLRQNILTGNILVHHPVDRLHLTDDLF